MPPSGSYITARESLLETPGGLFSNFLCESGISFPFERLITIGRLSFSVDQFVIVTLGGMFVSFAELSTIATRMPANLEAKYETQCRARHGDFRFSRNA